MAFWSLENAPSYWRKKSFWVLIGCGLVLAVGNHSLYSPSRNPEGRVVMYSASWCPFSAALRQHLAASGVPVIERDIVTSWAGWWGHTIAGGKRAPVPILLVGPTVIRGFRRAEVDAALTSAGYKPVQNASGPDGESVTN